MQNEIIIIERKALDQQFAEPAGGPLAKLRASRRPDAVADGEDGFEVVMINLAADLSASLGLNYSEFPNSCLGVQFFILKDISQVFVHGRHGHLKQFGDQFLGQPHRPPLQPHMERQCSILIDEHLAGGLRGWRGRGRHEIIMP